MSTIMEQTPLGKTVSYEQDYNPKLLLAIPRQLKRDEIAVGPSLPFKGMDIWNGFELSWLNNKGKPEVALAEFVFPHDSPNIIESKTFKLYLNSFNGTKFSSSQEVGKLMHNDLSLRAGAQVKVKIISLEEANNTVIKDFSGICLDKLDIECDLYTPDSALLIVEDEDIQETVFSHLLKSNCLVTEQPDWGSVCISYSGKKINHAGLLRYIVSYRNHFGFAEHCIEKMFIEILRHCKPKKLTVHGFYTRRGGLDINPLRSTEEIIVENRRLCRQ